MDLMIATYDNAVVPMLKNGAGTKGENLGSFDKYKDQVEEMMELVRDQRDKLDKEVLKWCQERGVPTNQ